MSKDTLSRVVAQTKWRNYIAPIDDDAFGRELYFHGYGRGCCTSDVQRAAFDAAARDAQRLLAAERFAADIMQIAAGCIEDDYEWIRGGC